MHEQSFSRTHMRCVLNIDGNLRKKVLSDALVAGMDNDGVMLDKGGASATAYADAIATYLALAISRAADYNSALAT